MPIQQENDHEEPLKLLYQNKIWDSAFALNHFKCIFQSISFHYSANASEEVHQNPPNIMTISIHFDFTITIAFTHSGWLNVIISKEMEILSLGLYKFQGWVYMSYLLNWDRWLEVGK